MLSCIYCRLLPKNLLHDSGLNLNPFIGIKVCRIIWRWFIEDDPFFLIPLEDTYEKKIKMTDTRTERFRFMPFYRALTENFTNNQQICNHFVNFIFCQFCFYYLIATYLIQMYFCNRIWYCQLDRYRGQVVVIHPNILKAKKI